MTEQELSDLRDLVSHWKHEASDRWHSVVGFEAGHPMFHENNGRSYGMMACAYDLENKLNELAKCKPPS